MSHSGPGESRGAGGASEPPPLCVDLDGTLLATDSLHELVAGLAAQRPLDLLRIPGWLTGGRAALKARLGERVTLDAARLPYRSEVIDALRAARAAGRRCVLVTAADRGLAGSVAAHLGLFDEVLASDGAANLKGRRKAERLSDRFGRGGFEYLGDAAADLPVWEAAGAASLAAPSDALLRRVAVRLPVARTVGVRPRPAQRARAWLRALRVPRWLANGLVLLPLLASDRVGEALAWRRAALAFAALSLAASALSVADDLLGLAADRSDAGRRLRPFASGELSIAAGVAAILLLLLLAVALAAWGLPPAFLGVLVLFVLAGGLYAFWKRVALAGAILLASLYTLRVAAGGAAVELAPSPRLLGLAFLFFLGAAFLRSTVGARRS